MEKYWPKHNDFPREVTADNGASSDDDSDVNDAEDNTQPASQTTKDTGADDNDDSTPDVAYARFRAQKAAQKAGFSGWQAEFRAWNKSFNATHTADMDLCKYWAVRQSVQVGCF